MGGGARLEGSQYTIIGNGDGSLLFGAAKARSDIVGYRIRGFPYGIKSAEAVISDGTPAFNDVDDTIEVVPGYDSGSDNLIVRSFDLITYQVDLAYTSENQEPANIIIRAIAPEGDFRWQTDALEKLDTEIDFVNDKENVIDIKFNTIHSGTGISIEVPLYVGAEKNGTVIEPIFEIFEEGVESQIDNILEPEAITVSARPNLNLLLNDEVVEHESMYVLEDNEYYKLGIVGYELQLQPLPDNTGTSKGLELPESKEEIYINFYVDAHRKMVNSLEEEMPVYFVDYGYNGGTGELNGTELTHNYLNINSIDTHILSRQKRNIR